MAAPKGEYWVEKPKQLCKLKNVLVSDEVSQDLPQMLSKQDDEFNQFISHN